MTTRQRRSSISPSRYDYLVKVLILGDSSVGKSSLLLRFADDDFSPSFITTIGIDFKLRSVRIDDKIVKLQIWDTAGQERFRTITQAYYRNAMGIFLCYDVTNEASFNNIKNWMRSVREHASPEVLMTLIGNKNDLVSSKKVKTETAQQLANEYHVPFFETSAKTNENVEDMFMSMVRRIVVNLSKNDLNDKQEQVLHLTNTTTSNTTCCSGLSKQTDEAPIEPIETKAYSSLKQYSSTKRINN